MPLFFSKSFAPARHAAGRGASEIETYAPYSYAAAFTSRLRATIFLSEQQHFACPRCHRKESFVFACLEHA